MYLDVWPRDNVISTLRSISFHTTSEKATIQKKSKNAKQGSYENNARQLTVKNSSKELIVALKVHIYSAVKKRLVPILGTLIL